jgi:hypothetical protein
MVVNSGCILVYCPHGILRNPRTKNQMPVRIKNPAMAYGQIAAGARIIPIPMKERKVPIRIVVTFTPPCCVHSASRDFSGSPDDGVRE